MNRENEQNPPKDSGGSEVSSILAEGIRCLDIAVLVRTPGEDGGDHSSLEIVGTAPGWWDAWLGGAASVIERSPFLEDFVSGAAAEFWDTPGSSDALHSGLWEESPADSELEFSDNPDVSGPAAPRFLEATASRTESGKALLLIEPADERLEREQGYQQTAHDLNLDRRRLQKELENKQILLGCIIHDLGNPLASVLINLENTAKQLTDQPHLQLTVQRAIEQTRRQQSLVKSISEVFAAELATMQTPNADGSEPPDLVAVAAEVLTVCAPSALERKVTLCPFFRSPLRVTGDRLYLGRLIENLLLNGIRHSPDGGAVMIRFEEKDGFALCRIEDKGPGIDPEDIDSIFKPFTQGTGDQQGKSGLGLYFCRLTAEMWGGRIEVWNRPEGGACFEVWLPRADTPPAQSVG